MDGPGKLIQRAARRARSMPVEKQAHAGELGERTAESLPPPPVSRHGSYTALMRSHDRVHTRHLAGGKG